MSSADNDLGFSYQSTKSGSVLISRNGKLVTTLGNANAEMFLKKVPSLSAPEQQQIMARVTGNYKRGNENNR